MEAGLEMMVYDQRHLQWVPNMPLPRHTYHQKGGPWARVNGGLWSVKPSWIEDTTRVAMGIFKVIKIDFSITF